MDTRPSPVLNEKPPFEDLYRQYWSGMLFYCIRKTGDRENAEDLVSDTFLYCFDHYDSFDPGKSAVSTWLYMVLNSRIKNYYRDRRESVDLTTLENLLSADGDDMEHAVWLQEIRGRLAEAIAALPERQRKAVILRYFKDKSSSEIAEALGTTPGNARVLLSRALDTLQESCRSLY
ncbi:MAG: sigma-70 family RNA polymerase sigma factor [Oscillospiraceae bacterium]|nr:sigma-70 family RNA polymerase sigma factor [Oscillospiraceae bacterium]